MFEGMMRNIRLCWLVSVFLGCLFMGLEANADVARNLSVLPTNSLPDVEIELHANQVSPTQVVDISTIKVGDSVTFSFKVSKSGYVSLWDIGTSNKVYRLFPNQFSKNMYVEAGKVYELAGNKSIYQIKTNLPIGMENVYLLWTEHESEQPISLNHEELDIGSRSYTTKDLSPVNRISTKRWATKRVAFEVTEDGSPQLMDFSQKINKSKNLQMTGIHGSVYVLSMGANTGGLTKASNDARNFIAVMGSLLSYSAKGFYPRLYSNTTVNDFYQGMEWLADNVSSNDTVIIFYSGHGSTLPDDNGDESDNSDEVFVMADAALTDYPDASDVVRDDQFAKMVGAIRTDQLVVVLDACHSGGMMKGGLESIDGRNKYFIGGLLGQVLSAFVERIHGGIDFKKGTAIVAAQEWSNAIEGAEGGILTTALLREMSAQNNTEKSWYDVVQIASEQVQQQANVRPDVLGDVDILKRIKLVNNK
jgi:hypothetical protein